MQRVGGCGGNGIMYILFLPYTKGGAAAYRGAGTVRRTSLYV